MASDDWIQESLARLEGLEAQLATAEAALESATDTDELRALSQQTEQLEGEIAALYQALEAAADDADDAGDDPAPASPVDSDDAPTGLFSREDLSNMAAAEGAPPLPTSVPQPGQEQLPPPQPQQPQQLQQPPQQGFGAPPQQQGFGAPPQQQGFGAPPQQQGFGAPPQQQGFGAPPQQQGFGAPQQQQGFGAPPQQQQGFGAPQQPGFGGANVDYAGDLDDDLKPKSKGPLIAILLGLAIAAGIGGYIVLSGDSTTEPVEENSGPAKVIKAGDVPPDTQGPKGAKGAGVDSVEGSKFKEGTSRPNNGGSRPNNGGSSSSKTKKKKSDGKTKIVETDDPLAGIDK